MVSRPIIIDGYDKTAVRNKKSRDRGKEFEGMIETACEFYSLRGIAEIEKTPEARQVIGRTGDRKSQMICVNAKKSQPDFKGTMNGGKSVVFEAKHTDKDRIEQSRVTEAQSESLEKHDKLGAWCSVLVSFGGKRFFRVPWYFWKHMKELYGRKYITPADVREFEVFETGGILDFLK